MAPLFDEAAALRYDRYYGTVEGRYVQRAEEACLRRLLPPPAGWALDVGTGTGVSADFLVRHGYAVVGVDVSGPMLAQARAKFRHLRHARFLEADAGRLPFFDRSFHLVLLHTVLEFVPDPAAAVREALRVVAKDGFVLVGSLDRRGAYARRAQEEARRRPESVFRAARFYTDEEVARLFGRSPLKSSAALFVAPGEVVHLAEAWRLEEEQRKRGWQAGYFALLFSGRE